MKRANKHLLITATLSAACLLGTTFGITCFAEEESPIVIGVSLHSMAELQLDWEREMEKAAEEYSVELITVNADNNIDKQITDIESLIVQNPDAIMVRAVDSSGIAGVLKQIKDAGIYCVASSYEVASDDYDLYLYAPQYDTGKLQADYLMDKLDNDPELELKVLYLWGAAGLSGCIDRYDGFKENLIDLSERAELLDEQIANWSTSEAMACAENWIQSFPEANCFVCQNDEMAVGVCNALVAAGYDMDKVTVLGIDGGTLAQDSIRAGQMEGSVYTDTAIDAQQQMSNVVKLVKGEELERDIKLTAKVMMTADNIDELIAE